MHHVAYERGQDVIMMKGYKFAKAKTAAAAMLGCLALANPATAAQLFQVTLPTLSQPHAIANLAFGGCWPAWQSAPWTSCLTQGFLHTCCACPTMKYKNQCSCLKVLCPLSCAL